MNAEPNYMTSTIINTGPLHEKQVRYGSRLKELKKELKEAKRSKKLLAKSEPTYEKPTLDELFGTGQSQSTC